jgi:hypothetical protein
VDIIDRLNRLLGADNVPLTDQWATIRDARDTILQQRTRIEDLVNGHPDAPTSSLETRVAHLERSVRILFDRGPT